MSSDYNKKSTPEINVKEYLNRKEIEYRYEVPVCVLDEDGRLRLWYPVLSSKTWIVFRGMWIRKSQIRKTS